MTEEELFHATLAKPSAERAAFLDQACSGNASLRAAVESLLAAHEAPGSFLNPTPPADKQLQNDLAATQDSGWVAEGKIVVTGEHLSGSGSAKDNRASQTATADFRTDPVAGMVIGGRYTLQKKIGEGGMGEVWVAKQTEPVKRKVALKLIKTGMDSRAVLQRFEQERQALALMDHPNIARVLDGGMTPTGQPFFVMELVNGLPLNQFCDELKLPLKERLQLFVPICQAVQHAHHKGIVHRDLKPANILVTMVDGRPVPKVIDFGVAKATAGKLTEETMSTGFGAIVGTLEYMSPEQAGFSNVDIDTRADIYSLGVILYELLTGLRPIDAHRLRQAVLTEMIRIIREEEPSKPSTRLSTNESLPSLAAMRHIEPRKLITLLRGDLDWVVMKCLEKQRERRYETANGLARDIQRHLDGEAVEACPPSVGYRLRKFLGRNKGPVMAASLLLLVLVIGICGTTWGMFAANRARRAEANQRTRAEDRESQAIDAVKKFRDAVANETALKNNPELEELRKRLLQEPLAFFRTLRDSLQADHDTSSESLARLAQASFELGELTAEIGDKQNALVAYQGSQELYQNLVDDNPADIEFRKQLASCHNELGALRQETGKQSEAGEQFEKALMIRQRLVDADPRDSELQSDLANTHYNIAQLLLLTGDPVKAMQAAESALMILKRTANAKPAVADYQISLANCYNFFGLAFRGNGKITESQQAYESALAIYERLVETNPTDPRFQRLQAGCHSNIASLMHAHGKPLEAIAAQKLAVTIQERVALAHPTVSDYQLLLAGLYSNLGNYLNFVGDSDEALKAQIRALAINQKLADANPTVTRFQFNLAQAHHNLGLSLGDAGKSAEALKSLRLAVATAQKLGDANPDIPEYQVGLARTQQSLANLLLNRGAVVEGMKSLKSALAIQMKLADAYPNVPEYQVDMAQSYLLMGNLLQATQRPTDALQALQSASEIHQKLSGAHPSNTEYRKLASEVFNSLGYLQARTLGPDEARVTYRLALANQLKLANEHPQSPEYASAVGATLNELAIIDYATERFDEARAQYLEAIEWQQKALEANPANAQYRQFLINHLNNLIKVTSRMGDSEGLAEAERQLESLQGLNPIVLALDAQLGAIVKGDQLPEYEAQRLLLADRAYHTALYATAVRLWGAALADNPKLADDRQMQHRYNAACAASLAAAGQGQNEPPLDEDAQTRLRKQALEWLTAELATWSTLLEFGPPEAKALIAQTLKHWQQDSDLAGIRDAAVLATIPESERGAWESFWKQLDELLAKASAEANSGNTRQAID